MISSGNFSFYNVVVEVNNNNLGPIAVPFLRVEEHDAGTNLEPEHVGRKNQTD